MVLDIQTFRSRFLDAAGQHDYPAVQRLLAEVELCLDTSSLLKQWYTYAVAYLALLERQQPDEAVSLLDPLSRDLHELTDELQGRILNALGIAYEMNEQWDKALQVFQTCLDLYQVQGNKLRQGITLANMANVYCKGMSYPDAIRMAHQAIHFLDDNPGEKEWQVNLGGAWNVLGVAQTEEKLWQEAEISTKMGLSIWSQWGDIWGQGIAHHNLGRIYQLQNCYEEAITHYSLARDHLLSVGDLRQASNTLSRLGQVHIQAGDDLSQAQALLDEALRLAQLTHNHENITYIHLRRAELQDASGNAAAALMETRKAVQAVEELRANIVQTETRIRLQGSRIEAYEKIVARLSRDQADVSEAFHYAEMCKSRVLIEMLAGRPTQTRRPEHIPAPWLEKEQALRQQLYSLYQNENVDQAEIQQLESDLNHLRSRIRWRDAEYESFQTVMPLTLRQVQAQIPQTGVLLEYFTMGDEVLVFVVTTTTAQLLPLPLQVSSLIRAFKQVGRRHLGTLHHITRNEDYRLHSPWILQSLYQKLIEPIEAFVHPAQTLYIVPHGLLHYVPFHALYQTTTEGSRYLLEQGQGVRQIIYAPSATTLFEYCQRKPVSQQEGCLAIGYDGQTLSMAEAEAQAVVAVLGGEAFCGQEATHDVLFAQASRYRYLHLSCHGWFNATWPMASSLFLSDQAVDVFTILRELRLNADLVCLSACETGQSHVMQGDELVGLTRAFLYAGTPSVMVSQWVVDELSTRLLMERFYEELQRIPVTSRGANAEALARAQMFLKNLPLEPLRDLLQEKLGDVQAVQQHLQILADSLGLGPVELLPGDKCLLSHPYYWAPFFLVGDRL